MSCASKVHSPAKRGVYEVGAHGCWGGSDTYTKDEIDFIAVYVVPENAWYLSPSKPRTAASACASIPTSLTAPATNTKNTAKPGRS